MATPHAVSLKELASKQKQPEPKITTIVNAAPLGLDLRDLDDANDAHWTDDGEPIVAVVQKLTGIDTLTREEVRASGRMRKVLAEAPAVLTEAPAAPVDTEKAVNDAEIAWQAAQRRVYAAREALRVAADKMSRAVMAFQFGPKLTVADLVRENSRREIARKMAVLRGEIEPDVIETPRPASHLDAVMQSGKGGSANFGYRRAAPGLRHKLPSEK